MTLTAAESNDVKLQNFIVKGDFDKDGVKETYEMDEDYTVTLPYCAMASMPKMAYNPSDVPSDMVPTEVYFAVSTGAELTFVTNTDANGEDGIGESLTWWFNGSFERDVIVKNGNDQATYTLKVAFEEP